MWQYKYNGQPEHKFNIMSADIIWRHCKDSIFDSLELGSGTGQLSKLLQSRKKIQTINMVDSSPTAIMYMTEYLNDNAISNYQLHKVSILSFANIVVDKKYDIVMSSGLIEHFKDKELKELCNIHKQFSNKYVVIIVPADNPENNAEALTEKHIKRYGYEKPMNEKNLDNLFIDSNFSHVHSERFYKNGKLLIAIYERM